MVPWEFESQGADIRPCFCSTFRDWNWEVRRPQSRRESWVGTCWSRELSTLVFAVPTCMKFTGRTWNNVLVLLTSAWGSQHTYFFSLQICESHNRKWLWLTKYWLKHVASRCYIRFEKRITVNPRCCEFGGLFCKLCRFIAAAIVSRRLGVDMSRQLTWTGGCWNMPCQTNSNQTSLQVNVGLSKRCALHADD